MPATWVRVALNYIVPFAIVALKRQKTSLNMYRGIACLGLLHGGVGPLGLIMYALSQSS